ncbi:MAG: hypothetical protein U0838_03410 [Chloroflexota bacterium]
MSASAYDNTNPAATVCGDTSHPVYTLRDFYLRYNNLIYAKLEIRWSKYCNTVWTRAINLTGTGTGYAPARSLTSDEKITVYNCPKESCAVHTETETGDVLPSNGSTGFSHQFSIPAPGTTGSPAAPQPPLGPREGDDPRWECPLPVHRLGDGADLDLVCQQLPQ